MNAMWLFRSSRIAPWVLSLMRMAVGFMFLSVGTMKMFGFPSRGGAVIGFDPFTQIGLAAIIEVFGGTLLLLGLATRPVAFIMSGEMAVAYFQVYAPQAFFPVVNGGHPAALFSWIFFYLAFAGAGPWSLDALIADAGARRGVEATTAAYTPAWRPGGDDHRSSVEGGRRAGFTSRRITRLLCGTDRRSHGFAHD